MLEYQLEPMEIDGNTKNRKIRTPQLFKLHPVTHHAVCAINSNLILNQKIVTSKKRNIPTLDK